MERAIALSLEEMEPLRWGRSFGPPKLRRVGVRSVASGNPSSIPESGWLVNQHVRG